VALAHLPLESQLAMHRRPSLASSSRVVQVFVHARPFDLLLESGVGWERGGLVTERMSRGNKFTSCIACLSEILCLTSSHSHSLQADSRASLHLSTRTHSEYCILSCTLRGAQCGANSVKMLLLLKGVWTGSWQRISHSLAVGLAG
jgi:hypothetical protein